MGSTADMPWYDRINVDNKTLTALGLALATVVAGGIVLCFFGKAICVCAVSFALITMFTAGTEKERQR